jgi:uncharacterized membrane protein YcaP (DUF421 family)
MTMLHHARELLAPFEQTLALYMFLIAALRLLGRRQMGQLTVVDLTIIILLGSAVETAMIAGDTSLAAGLVSAATLLVANRLLAFLLCRSRRLRHLVAGEPVLLIHNGQFVEEHLKRMGLLESEVLTAIRERGCGGLEEVRFAVLEPDGSINVVSTDAKVKRSRSDIRRASKRPHMG